MSVTIQTTFKAKEDFKVYASVGSGGGNCLGGAIHPTFIPSDVLHNLFNNTPSYIRINGGARYRGFYLKNTGKLTAKNIIVTVDINTSYPNDEIFIGFDPAGLGDGTLTGKMQGPIANEETEPNSIIWKNGNDRYEDQHNIIVTNLDLPPNKCLPFWVKQLTKPGGQRKARNFFRLAFHTDNKQGALGTATIPKDSTIGGIGNPDENPISSDLLRRLGLRALSWFILGGNITTRSNASSMIGMLSNWRLKDKSSVVWGSRNVQSLSLRNQITNAFNMGSPGIERGYYSKDVNNVHLAFLDVSGFQSIEAGSSHYENVRDDLRSAKRDPDIDFIVVAIAGTMYGALPKEDLTTPEDETKIYHSEVLQKIYHPVLVENGVHLILQMGNIRNYQRMDVLGPNLANPSVPGRFFTGQATATGANYTINTVESGDKGFGPTTGCVVINDSTGGQRPLHLLKDPIPDYVRKSHVPGYGGFWVLNAKMFDQAKKQNPYLEYVYYEYFPPNHPSLFELLFNPFNLFKPPVIEQEKFIDRVGITLKVKDFEAVDPVGEDSEGTPGGPETPD